MFRQTIHTLLLATALTLANSANAGMPGKQKITSPLTKVEASIQGQRVDGDPVIVLIHGLGSDMSTWKKVLPGLAVRHQVFAYNRPGYGNSGWSSRSRNARNIAEELRASLTAAGLAPPYLIVGHSLGGVYAQAFASMYPDETSALVLVDTAVPHQRAMLERNGLLQSVMVGNLILNWSSPMPRREYFNQNDNDAQMDTAPLYAKGPVTLLMASHLDQLSPDSYVHARQEAMRTLAGRYGATLIPVESGHFIQKEHPEAVIDAITAVTGGKKSEGE
jgi:pimeloyl-ACP methyl ester carboxylesterase